MTAVRWEARGDAVGYVEDGDFTMVARTEGDNGAAESMAARQQFTEPLTDNEVAELLTCHFNVAAAPELLERLEANQRLIDWLLDHKELSPYLENIDGVWARLCNEFDANGAAIERRGER